MKEDSTLNKESDAVRSELKRKSDELWADVEKHLNDSLDSQSSACM